MILPPLVVVVDVVVFVVMVGFHLFCARWEVQPQPQQKITHLRERFYCYFCRSSGERRHSSFRVRFGSDWSAARTIVLASPSMLTTSTPMGYDEDSRIIQKHATSPPHPSHPPRPPRLLSLSIRTPPFMPTHAYGTHFRTKNRRRAISPPCDNNTKRPRCARPSKSSRRYTRKIARPPHRSRCHPAGRSRRRCRRRR